MVHLTNCKVPELRLGKAFAAFRACVCQNALANTAVTTMPGALEDVVAPCSAMMVNEIGSLHVLSSMSVQDCSSLWTCRYLQSSYAQVTETVPFEVFAVQCGIKGGAIMPSLKGVLPDDFRLPCPRGAQ